jgi:cytochrome P450
MHGVQSPGSGGVAGLGPVAARSPWAIDFGSESFLTDPWPVYAYLRAHDPVHWSADNHCFFLLRHERVREALARRDFTVDFPFRASRQLFGPNLLDVDGPAHRELRRLIAPAFNAAAVEGYAGRAIEPVVRELLDGLAGRDRVDFVADFAARVPYGVVCRLMGIPAADAPWLYAQMRPVVHNLDYPRGPLDPALAARRELEAYFSALLVTQRAAPPDTILGALQRGGGASADAAGVDAAGADAAGHVLGTTLLLLLAATETSISAIANVMACLLRHPGALAGVAARPGSIPAVVAESLRWEPPLHSVLRFAAEDINIDGVLIPRRAAVQLSLASANRDAAAFGDPDRWDPGRAERAHLTFGGGRHGCPGFQLASRELHLIYQLLIERFATIESDGDDIPLIRGHVFRRPTSLPVRWAPRTTA